MFDYSKYNKVKPKPAKPVKIKPAKAAAAPVALKVQNFVTTNKEVIDIPRI